METKIAAVPPAPDPGLNRAKVSEPLAKASPPPVATGPDPVDLRLIIEEDQGSGSYVYKTVNRVTGEVLQQFPRDDVLKLHSQPRYSVGTVIDTEA